MTNTTEMSYKYVDDRWDDAVADALSPLERLVYRSNILGDDWRITNTGGGNTSSKLVETDPVSGEEVEVLWERHAAGGVLPSGRADAALRGR